MISLQCCVGFHCTTVNKPCVYTRALSGEPPSRPPSPPSRASQSAEPSTLRCTQVPTSHLFTPLQTQELEASGLHETKTFQGVDSLN